VCVETFRKRTPFFEKIRKNAEPHRNRNGVHGNFKNNPAPSLSPELPGQSSRKVSSLFRHDRRIMRVFHAGKRRLPAWTRPQLANNAFTERAPKSRIGLSRGDVGQLSVERWGRYKPGRQTYEHAIVASAGPGETVKLAASHWFG
jgi:hypothetical protein